MEAGDRSIIGGCELAGGEAPALFRFSFVLCGHSSGLVLFKVCGHSSGFVLFLVEFRSIREYSGPILQGACLALRAASAGDLRACAQPLAATHQGEGEQAARSDRSARGAMEVGLREQQSFRALALHSGLPALATCEHALGRSQLLTRVNMPPRRRPASVV